MDTNESREHRALRMIAAQLDYCCSSPVAWAKSYTIIWKIVAAVLNDKPDPFPEWPQDKHKDTGHGYEFGDFKKPA